MTSQTPRSPKEISLTWLDSVLVNDEFEGSSLLGFDVESVGETVGFLGDLFCIKPHYESNSERYPASLIIKFPTLRNDESREAGNGLFAYEREAMFYRHFANECPANPPRYYHSEYMGESEEYVLLMEDLKNARFIEQVDGISKADAVAVAEGLAKLHAHYWQSTVMESSSWLRGFDQWGVIYPPQIDVGWPLMKQNFGYLIPGQFMDLFPIANDAYPAIAEYMQSHRPNTLVHGDARMENMAFEMIDGKERLRIFDWQLVSSGPAAYDLVYFFCSSINPDQWKEWGQNLIDVYHESLCLNSVSDYPKEQLMDDIRLSLCLFFGFISMVGNIVGPDEAGKAVMEASAPRFWAIMDALDVGDSLQTFLAGRQA